MFNKSSFGVLVNVCCLQANNKGVGVIGVIECNFLDPIHNKQNFNENDKYRYTDAVLILLHITVQFVIMAPDMQKSSFL